MVEMRVPPRSCRLLGHQRFPRPANRAFSLVELMIAVLIISLLFLMGVPTYQRIQRKTRATAIANDLRVFGSAFQTNTHEKGTWPPEAAPGVIPTGISVQEIQSDKWQNATPIGGHFDWEYNQVHPGGTSPGGKWHAAIAISSTSGSSVLLDADLMQAIDAELDDGDLTTGNFRSGFGDVPIYILEP